jgi:hypothetical protein
MRGYWQELREGKHQPEGYNWRTKQSFPERRISMKTSPTRSFPAVGLGLFLSALLSSSAIAGPGPEFWLQRARDLEAARKPTPIKAAPMACANCKTTAITEFRPGGAAGKIPARHERIGSKHTCSSCRGEITTVRGRTTNGMQDDCPVCQQAKTEAASCCVAKA